MTFVPAIEKFQNTFIADAHAKVRAHVRGAHIVRSEQFRVADIVAVYPVAFERVSNVTVSELVGSATVATPPDVVANRLATQS